MPRALISRRVRRSRLFRKQTLRESRTESTPGCLAQSVAACGHRCRTPMHTPNGVSLNHGASQHGFHPDASNEGRPCFFGSEEAQVECDANQACGLACAEDLLHMHAATAVGQFVVSVAVKCRLHLGGSGLESLCLTRLLAAWRATSDLCAIARGGIVPNVSAAPATQTVGRRLRG
jgi:hypothetical protein